MSTKPIERSVAGRTFSVHVPVRLEEGEEVIDVDDARRMERAIACALALEGPVHGEAVTFMRKTLALRVPQLAELLALPAERIVAWESGAQPVETLAWLAIGDLVLEAAGQPSAARERLERIQRGHTPPKERRVDL